MIITGIYLFTSLLISLTLCLLILLGEGKSYADQYRDYEKKGVHKNVIEAHISKMKFWLFFIKTICIFHAIGSLYYFINILI